MLDLFKNNGKKRFFSLFLLFLILCSNIVFGSGIISLIDKPSAYSPNQEATVCGTCTLGNEKNVLGNWVWKKSDGTILRNVTDSSGDCQLSLFCDSYTFQRDDDFSGEVNWTTTTSSWNNVGDVTVDSFIVNGTSLFECVIANVTPQSTGYYVGMTGAVKFSVIDGDSVPIVSARCNVEGLLNDETPVVVEPMNLPGKPSSSNGHVSFDTFLSRSTFTEDTTYLFNIHCDCGDNSSSFPCYNENTGLRTGFKSCEVVSPFVINSTLRVNTLTDKSDYFYRVDDEVVVCANVTNFRNVRESLEIVYNFRCGLNNNNNATDRVVVNSFTELRGISANTTQMQCAGLDIVNIPTVQNQVSVCYAATDVRVLDGMAGEFKVVYATTSANFTLTSDRSSLGGDNMNFVWIVFVLFVILLGLGLLLESANFVSLAGFVCFVLGIFVFREGMPGVSNVFLENAFSIVIIGVGMVLVVVPQLENLQDLFRGDSD